MKRSIDIRLFRPSDLERIMEIERDAFPEAPYTPAMFRDLYRDCGALFFVARVGRRTGGYMVTCVDARRAEVVSIAVDPRFQRLGIGTALMTHSLTELKASKVRRVDLMVRETSRHAVRFYRRFGFTRVRCVRRYYENGGDAVHMTKALAR
jgi:[ribosomal protein S18]-alanine N-acetyltransferase